MKVYKFRPIVEGKNSHLIDILRTGEFHCSCFTSLNDPMEGTFSLKKETMNDIVREKNKYKICSFSGKKALESILMWGYYANGMKGVALEVEVPKRELFKVKYEREIPKIIKIKEGSKEHAIKKILTTKLDLWEHEDEYRFLIEDQETEEEGLNKEIGKITSVYFGYPYRSSGNWQHIKKTKALQCYLDEMRSLITLIKDKDNKTNIKIYLAKSIGRKVSFERIYDRETKPLIDATDEIVNPA